MQPMQLNPERIDRSTVNPMGIAVVLICAAVVMAAARVVTWPFVHDAPLIHYVVFLMSRGRAPYRDIVEMNLPGSYMMDWVVMHVLGAGARGWVLWDLTTGLATIFACAWIAGPRRRAAGVIAGALACLIHWSYGPADLGQRDWVIAILLLLAAGFLFALMRTERPVWIAGAMMMFAIAASIKPQVILIAGCFLGYLYWRHKASRWRLAVLTWSLVGITPPVLLVCLFLWRWGVTREFLAMLRGLVPWYASLQRLGLVHLLIRSEPAFLLPFAAVAALLSWKLGTWRQWQSSFLTGGIAAGIFMFVLQRKGWPYHRYTAIVFLLLWLMLQIAGALHSSHWQRTLAMATLALLTLVVTPILLYRALTVAYPMDTLHHLEADLQSRGGDQLNGNVQCLDMTMGGCINVLYRLKLVQSTGFIYDYYLFPQTGNAVTSRLQNRFLAALEEHPPKFLVLSSHTWPGDLYSYDQLSRWPAFEALLRQRYRIDTVYPGNARDGAGGYRIYGLRENPSQP